MNSVKVKAKPKAKQRRCGPTPHEVEVALNRIACMGAGIKPEIVDWANIGKNAVNLAKETFREKCIECGK